MVSYYFVFLLLGTALCGKVPTLLKRPRGDATFLQERRNINYNRKGVDVREDPAIFQQTDQAPQNIVRSWSPQQGNLRQGSTQQERRMVDIDSRGFESQRNLRIDGYYPRRIQYAGQDIPNPNFYTSSGYSPFLDYNYNPSYPYVQFPHYPYPNVPYRNSPVRPNVRNNHQPITSDRFPFNSNQKFSTQIPPVSSEPRSLQMSAISDPRHTQMSDGVYDPRYNRTPVMPDQRYTGTPHVNDPRLMQTPVQYDPRYMRTSNVPYPQYNQMPDVFDSRYTQTPVLSDPRYNGTPGARYPQYIPTTNLSESRYLQRPALPNPRYTPDAFDPRYRQMPGDAVAQAGNQGIGQFLPRPADYQDNQSNYPYQWLPNVNTATANGGDFRQGNQGNGQRWVNGPPNGGLERTGPFGKEPALSQFERSVDFNNNQRSENLPLSMPNNGGRVIQQFQRREPSITENNNDGQNQGWIGIRESGVDRLKGKPVNPSGSPNSMQRPQPPQVPSIPQGRPADPTDGQFQPEVTNEQPLNINNGIPLTDEQIQQLFGQSLGQSPIGSQSDQNSAGSNPVSSNRFNNGRGEERPQVRPNPPSEGGRVIAPTGTGSQIQRKPIFDLNGKVIPQELFDEVSRITSGIPVAKAR